MARSELLCIYTSSFTHMLCFQAGKERGAWKRQELQEQTKAHEAAPCRAGRSLVSAWGAGMLGSVQNWRDEPWVGRGEART